MIQTVAVLFFLNFSLVLFFSLLYWWVAQTENSFHGIETLTYLDAVYFSIVTQTTLGYGDIVPRDPMAKLVVIFQELIFIIQLVCLAALL